MIVSVIFVVFVLKNWSLWLNLTACLIHYSFFFQPLKTMAIFPWPTLTVLQNRFIVLEVRRNLENSHWQLWFNLNSKTTMFDIAKDSYKLARYPRKHKIDCSNCCSIGTWEIWKCIIFRLNLNWQKIGWSTNSCS